MPTSFFETARDIVTPILPWASASPPWSGPSPREIGPTYGTLFATPVACDGWALHHDRAGRHHAMTLDSAPGDVLVMFDRRWKVVPLIGPQPASAVQSAGKAVA